MANFAGVRDRAEDAKIKNNMKQLQTALRLYYNDNQSYPGTNTTATCSSLGLSSYISTNDLPAKCYYYRPTSDTFTACAQITNTADMDREALADRCVTEPSMNAVFVTNYFCVCSN